MTPILVLQMLSQVLWFGNLYLRLRQTRTIKLTLNSRFNTCLLNLTQRWSQRNIRGYLKSFINFIRYMFFPDTLNLLIRLITIHMWPSDKHGFDTLYLVALIKHNISNHLDIPTYIFLKYFTKKYSNTQYNYSF